ncbi:MAG: peptidoglycan-binding protein [Verrucomicrobiota bacterium]|nr:peptidoglycan-binding protein [Verrucomicrobiota bacterium]
MKTLRTYLLLGVAVCALSAFATTSFARDYYGRDDDRGYYPRSDVRIGVRYGHRSHYSGRRHSIEAQVQLALARRGFYRGPIDGDIGHGSRHAIYDYQRSHRLPATGRIDRYLLRSLGI